MATAAVVLVANLICISVDPFGSIFFVFWTDLLIALAGPVVVKLTAPRGVHWLMLAGFVLTVAGAARWSLHRVVQASASV